MKDIINTVDVGAQVQQIINVECRNVFFDPILLEIKFQYVYTILSGHCVWDMYMHVNIV